MAGRRRGECGRRHGECGRGAVREVKELCPARHHRDGDVIPGAAQAVAVAAKVGRHLRDRVIRGAVRAEGGSTGAATAAATAAGVA